ncbi:MAG: SulP family inorganic anion transporter [Candidatus Sericytochromatia bacterium]
MPTTPLKAFTREFTFKHLSSDIPAALAVFLVAIPLCLGIAHASGTPLLSGLISGIIGGIVVGIMSKSPLSVSGPAAGLTAIVAAGVMELKSFELFLVAVVLAGVVQIILGIIKAGVIGSYIPNTVIKGMLAAIGLILILKQTPHLLGYDKEAEGVEKFAPVAQDLESKGHGHENTFELLWEAMQNINWEIFAVGLLSLAILLFWDKVMLKRLPAGLKIIPGSLIAVVAGTLAVFPIEKMFPGQAFTISHMVHLPAIGSLGEFFQQIALPNWSGLSNPAVYKVAITIAFVASLESLLSIEAIDKLDPHRRKTPLSRELMAQGSGNILCGLFGGIPVTSVIVRSSVNMVAGGQTKLVTIMHGCMIIIALAFFSGIINQIPLTSLAAVLIMTGFKLAHPKVFSEKFKLGWSQSVPFVITVLAILFSDLLIGVLIGFVVSGGFILHNHYKARVIFIKDQENRKEISFGPNLTFLNQVQIMDVLQGLPENSHIVLDGKNIEYIDADISEYLQEFVMTATDRGQNIELNGFPSLLKSPVLSAH